VVFYAQSRRRRRRSKHSSNRQQQNDDNNRSAITRTIHIWWRCISRCKAIYALCNLLFQLWWLGSRSKVTQTVSIERTGENISCNRTIHPPCFQSLKLSLQASFYGTLPANSALNGYVRHSPKERLFTQSICLPKSTQ